MRISLRRRRHFEFIENHCRNLDCFVGLRPPRNDGKKKFRHCEEPFFGDEAIQISITTINRLWDCFVGLAPSSQ